tara:strand:- start:621 stop:899 length:279 start_codon:yes stop_codon:yes gene_type:complete
MAINNKRSIVIIFFILFFGCIVGTALSQLFGTILPEGVVKDFLLNSTSIGWGDSDKWVDFNVIKFKTGFYINISVVSLIGMIISWYFLRYFR